MIWQIFRLFWIVKLYKNCSFHKKNHTYPCLWIKVWKQFVDFILLTPYRQKNNLPTIKCTYLLSISSSNNYEYYFTLICSQKTRKTMFTLLTKKYLCRYYLIMIHGKAVERGVHAFLKVVSSILYHKNHKVNCGSITNTTL